LIDVQNIGALEAVIDTIMGRMIDNDITALAIARAEEK